LLQTDLQTDPADPCRSVQVYVLVTDVHPLTVYLYTDGLARFCTDLYEAPDEDNLDMREMHFTNFSINWESEAFEPGLLFPTAPLLSLLYLVIQLLYT